MTIDDPLPTLEKKDGINVRPPLNLEHMLNQVRGIQTFIATERERKNADEGTVGRDRAISGINAEN